MNAVPVPSSTGSSEAAGRRAGVRRRVGRRVVNAAAVFALLYLFAPIAIIVVFSFNRPAGKFNLVWQHFTLRNWQHPFARKELTEAMALSLRVAVLAAFIATALGTLVALALTRYRFKGSAAVNLLLVLPLTTPEIVLGASLASLFIQRGVNRGFVTILIAHVMFCLSFVALTVKARLRGFDWTLEDAAMDLGAGPLRTFRRVTLPLIAPGILAAFLLSFAISIDDFITTLFNAGNRITYPLQIFGASRAELPPQVHVLGTMVLMVGVVFLVGGALIGMRRSSSD